MPLPLPDSWEFTQPPFCTCLVTDDGSATTSKLAQRLTDKGWRVVVLSLPDCFQLDRVELTSPVQRVVLKDLSEAQLQKQLEAIAQNFGSISTFIHLHPVQPVSEKALLKTVFFLAKHLKVSLNQNSALGRKSFLTVARLDGQLGLGQVLNYSAIQGGLFGLTKTLALEWENIFCRAIDLSPELEAEQSANAIVSELHDPNVFVREVGYSDQGRMTLTV